MHESTSNFDHYRQGSTSSDAVVAYSYLVNKCYKSKELTQDMYLHLLSLPLDTFDEIDQAAHELLHALVNKRYYVLLDRIEKGEKMLSEESDPDKRRQYKALLDKLCRELEELTLEGAAA